MDELTSIMFKPFVACLLLAGIHSYLGLHVIARQVIFVDLALAQVAAFGATLGFVWGWELHSSGSYFTSLVFTIICALIFSFFRSRKQIVPTEALIGITYAMAAAASVLVLSTSPEGGEELKSLMVGHLLFVEWPEIIKMFVIYGAVGAVHYIFRYKFLLISTDPDKAYEENINVKFWDFLFYAFFGIVVTSSTELAGVLLVFSYLIVPAVCSLLFSERLSTRLLISWLIGIVTSIAGILASYYMDLPSGAAIVCVFGMVLVFCFFISSAKSIMSNHN
jgi:zinc/manganese transport system permease protein